MSGSQLINWSPTQVSPVNTEVVLQVYDTRGGHTTQSFTVGVTGGNHRPVFNAIPAEVRGREGQPLQLTVGATDADRQPLSFWVENLPASALFNSQTRTLSWTPGFEAAGTYDVTFVVSDGIETVQQTSTVLITATNQAPTLMRPTDRTLQEGETLRLQLQASDPEGATLTYSSQLLPGGARLDPHSGVFEWTPGFFQAGTFTIPFTVSDGTSITTQTTTITVTNVNAAPVFDRLSHWQVQEGQAIRFQAFAFDPDNPAFVPQERMPNGQLTVLEGSHPSVSYTVSGLPGGATFDPDTALFTWNPGYTSAGTYAVTFTAIDDGNGLSAKQSTITVPITVLNTNRQPTIAAIGNQTLSSGETREITIQTNDLDNNPLVLSATGQGGFGLPGFAQLIDHHNGTATLRLTPGTNDGGDYTLTVTATDNGDGNPQAMQQAIYAFVVSVNAPNAAPQLNFIGDKVAIVGQPLQFEVKASDRNQDGLSYALSGLPGNATLVSTSTYGTARFQWTPTETGAYTATIGIQDSGNGDLSQRLTAQQTFQLVVRQANQAPMLATVSPQTIAEGQTLTLPLLATDADGDALTYTATNLPVGAVLDPRSGVLSWTPTLLQAGSYGFDVTASDGHRSHTQPVTVRVNNTNQAPVLTPLPTQFGQENVRLQFTLAASDADLESPLFTAVTPLPAGAAFDSRTGQFRWQPDYEQAGNYVLRFGAKDAAGATTFTDVSVQIVNVNRTPVIGGSNHAVALGETLAFNVAGSDPDLNTTLIYGVDRLPEGATFNPQTGEFRWVPTAGQVGDYTVNFTVSDGVLTATQATVLRVETAAKVPAVTIDLTPSFAAVPGQKVILQAAADSLADITRLTLSVNGQPLTLDGQGRGVFTPTTPGRFQVAAIATDADGRVGQSQTVLKVRDTADSAAPVVSFAPGLAGRQLTGVMPIVGTVSDSNLDEWVLQIADFGENTFRTIAQGHSSINGGVLSQFDPGSFTNGFYQLRLSATDISGRTSVTTAIVESNSPIKSGQYQQQQTDLTVNLGGVNLNLVRSYDSLQADEAGLFGAGWHLSTESQIQTNVPLSGREATGVYNPFQVGTRLYLTTPTGERVGFTFAPQKQELAGLTYYTPAWVSDAGVNYTLKSADAVLAKQGDRFYELNTARPYNPASGAFAGAEYTLVATDGTQYHLSTTEGVKQQIVPNGVKLHYSDSGIVSSTGEAIGFVQDQQGRLTQVSAPDGSLIRYGYEQGNLVSVRHLGSGETSRYGYSDGLLTLATARPGEAGAAINYGAMPQVQPVIADLGGATQFAAHPTTGTLAADGVNRYSFGLRESEVRSTATGVVLIGVEMQATGAGLEPSVPGLRGFTPVESHLAGDRAFALYAIDRAGLQQLDLSGTAGATYALQVSIAGDINRDGTVDGSDSRLLMNAIGQSYDSIYDLNRDGSVNATDVQILGGNYGFVANRAPVVTPITTLTHEDLETMISLRNLATDPEGDAIAYRVANPVNGTVTLTADGQSVRFIPTVDFTGIVSFDLVADDGFSVSAPTRVTVNVSDAPLINLDFVKRNPRLGVGEATELIVMGDFADQQDVVLPDSYLRYGSENGTIATIDANGVVTGLMNGVSVLSATREGIQAVTVTRVGELQAPANQQALNVAIAEIYGLNLYPQAVTLTEGITRQLLVGFNGVTDSPDLKSGSTGTRYFISNPAVLQVDANGLITTLNAGVANVTVVYGASEFVVPVRVETPHLGTTTLGMNGGVVQATDGATVMVAPGALTENTTIDIHPLSQAELTLAIPEKFSFAGAFQLAIGDDPLTVPVQLAIPAPQGLAVGTEVFLMRQGELPDATGTWKPIWFMEESAVVGNNGMIRTQSPPWPGVRQSGTYSIAVPSFRYNVATATLQNQLYNAGVESLSHAVTAAMLGSMATGVAFGVRALGSFAGAVLLDPEENSVDVVSIPRVGRLPYTSTAQVELNPQGIPTITIPPLSEPAPGLNDPYAPPVLHSAALSFNDRPINQPDTDPVVYLDASNVLVNSDGLGSHLEDLVVYFQVGNQTYQGTVVPQLSVDLGNNHYQVAVRPPETIALGNAEIELVRRQSERRGPGAADIEIVEYRSAKDIRFTPPRGTLERTLVAQVWNDTVTVINAADAQITAMLGNAEQTSLDLIAARIPVGTPDQADGSRYVTATRDAARAYVSLEQSGRVAVVDLLMLRQVDTDPTAAGVNPIDLAYPDAMPGQIVIGPDDQYAYVADRQQGSIYVIDINPASPYYNQQIGTIPVDAPYGIKDLAVSVDQRRLFVTADRSSATGNGEILVINLDLADRLREGMPNSRNWHRQIGKVEAGLGLESIAATPYRNSMVFTNRKEDPKGFGVLTITNDDPLSFAATTKYVDLKLGSWNDAFDVNEAMSAVVTPDGKYAFVAGRNGRSFGIGAASVDGPGAGSNVGIIKDPFTDQAELVAATRPIPLGLTTDLSLSSDGKYLFASYPGVGSVLAFDVAQIDQTIAAQQSNANNPLSQTPIDAINPNVVIAGDFQVATDWGNNSQYGVGDLKNAPLGLGFNPYGMAQAANPVVVDFLPLPGAEVTALSSTTTDLTPTLTWRFDAPLEEIQEVNLFISTFQQGEGLLPWDAIVNVSDPELLQTLGMNETEARDLLSDPWQHYDDFNPGRIVTATWKRDTNSWYWHDGTTLIAQPTHDLANTLTRFTLPDSRTLTAGQSYYMAVQAVTTQGEKDIDFAQVETIVPPATTPFSSVTVLTHGFTLFPDQSGIDPSMLQMANSIAKTGSNGLILKYDKPTGYWQPIDGKGNSLPTVTSGLNPSDPGYLDALVSGLRSSYQHKGLVFLPDWSSSRGESKGESIIPNAGFTEAAADAFFASLVQLDQKLTGFAGVVDGEFVRTQGDLFNSPLHFIGFSRGTVVNSEMIQRLGTFYPDAGGTSSATRDLQMTTIDPHDFAQPSLDLAMADVRQDGQVNLLRYADFSDFYEPQVQLWNNVTFADNYYQTVADPDVRLNSATPNGRFIPADAEILLGTRAGQEKREQSRIGFTKDDHRGGPHTRTLAWYAGTVDLDLLEAQTRFLSDSRIPIIDRLSEASAAGLFDPAMPDAQLWYSNGDGEGIHEGWFYSVLGGGKEQRTEHRESRIDVKVDNTPQLMQGDFAVPTLFNGDFDQYLPDRYNSLHEFGLNLFSPKIPGWSFHNGGEASDLSPRLNLASWSQIAGKSSNFLNRLQELSIDPNAPEYQTNYAVELSAGDSITHNRFVVPDWGALRFNLHVPEIDQVPTLVGQNYPKLRVFMTETGLEATEYELTVRTVVRDDDRFASPPRQSQRLTGVEIASDSSPFRPDYHGNRISYGVEGFETFQLDVPDQLRGKSATLRFELDQDSNTVYLDDVFFQSSHLLLGNPTEARIKFNPDLSEEQNDVSNSIYQNNYLMEKPQYTIAYSRTDNTPLWASWQLNKTWLGSLGREDFEEDLKLPYDWYKVVPNDYDNDENKNLSELQILGTIDPNDGKPFEYQPGHVVPAADRDRNRKDSYEVSLLSNILPQHEKNNSPVWSRLEQFSRDLVEDRNKELYIVAGRGGSSDAVKAFGSSEYIDVPDYLWKVIAVFDKPGQGASDITANTKVIAVISQNDEPPLTGEIDPKYQRWYEGGMEIVSVRELENRLNADPVNRGRGIHYDFFSNVAKDIQEVIENQVFIPGNNPLDQFPILNANLMAEPEASTHSFTTVPNTAIWHDSVLENNATEIGTFQISSSQVRSFDSKSSEVNPSQISSSKIGLDKISTFSSYLSQVGFSQIGTSKSSSSQISASQVGSSQVNSIQAGISQSSITQIYSLQNSTIEIKLLQPCTTEVSPTQINSTQIYIQFSPSKITLSGSIPSEQLFSIDSAHSLSSTLIYNINNSALTLWKTSPSPQNSIALNLVVKDLPVGQLAEAQITQSDPSGRPIAATLLLDTDANGLGWFIDPTPWENSEFASQTAETTYKSTPGSAAYGHYDLLTTVLHELGHIAGLISGNPAYDAHIQTLNGTPTFIGNGFSAPLTADRSHLTTPSDLMSPYLAPGMRKLPSTLDLQILNAVQQWDGEIGRGGDRETVLSAPAHSTPLIGINNGSFDLSNPDALTYAWETRGDAQILAHQAVLSEHSPLQSNFSQTFIVPQGAKALQFTITGANLERSTLAPGDAFEAALLDARTLTPLIAPATGLSQTDAFLNLQHTGQSYLGSHVTLTGADATGTIALHTPHTITVDLTDIAPGTLATLYFDLLGFGTQTGFVTLDNVVIIRDTQQAPIAIPDTASLNQGEPIVLTPLANDSDPDGTLTPTSLQLHTSPSHGSLTLNPDGTLIYTPTPGYVGSDRFTYSVQDNDGIHSNETSVTLTVNNLAPTITNITKNQTLSEGQSAQFTASAIDPGNDALTYTWNFGDGSDPISGQTINHTFADNGNYTASLTVTDTHGASTTQTQSITVANAAPIVNAGADQTLNQGQSVTFNGSYSDPGILDTHTYTWDFGDGTIVTDSLTPSHIYSQNGTYTATLSVTDKDGATTIDTVTITVNNLAPTITAINGDRSAIEGQTLSFSATATDPGNDALTYTWNFGDGTALVTGATAQHTYADNGSYTATLTVRDSDGAETRESFSLTVNNAAPIVNAGADQTIAQGQAITFTGSFTDPGILDTHTVTWDFGDGTTQTGSLTPSHHYNTPGSYTAILTITDKDGATQQDTRQIIVTPTALTHLKLDTHHLQLNISENGSIVETYSGSQNLAVPNPQARLQITALNSADRFTLADDRTFLDHNEGIGIKDGEDGSSASQKRIALMATKSCN